MESLILQLLSILEYSVEDIPPKKPTELMDLMGIIDDAKGIVYLEEYSNDKKTIQEDRNAKRAIKGTLRENVPEVALRRRLWMRGRREGCADGRENRVPRLKLASGILFFSCNTLTLNAS